MLVGGGTIARSGKLLSRRSSSHSRRPSQRHIGAASWATGPTWSGCSSAKWVETG